MRRFYYLSVFLFCDEKSTIFEFMKKMIFLLFALSALACNNDDDDDIICTQIDRITVGLNVKVKDAITNNYLGLGTTVTAKDGNYSETLVFLDRTVPVFAGAVEREGNYILRVSAEGYANYVSERIKVTSDGCNVIPQHVEVLLQPE